MWMLDLAKQGKQELHTLSFPSLHAPSHPSDPMKGRGPLSVPGEKVSHTFRVRGELRTGLGTGHLLGTAPEHPPSRSPL